MLGPGGVNKVTPHHGLSRACSAACRTTTTGRLLCASRGTNGLGVAGMHREGGVIMTDCELCGRKNADHSVVLEGVRMTTCAACSRHGKPAPVLPAARQRFAVADENEPQLDVEYAAAIRSARQKAGLSIEQLAKKACETKSFLRKVEAGQLKPTEKIARRLESILNIKIFE